MASRPRRTPTGTRSSSGSSGGGRAGADKIATDARGRARDDDGDYDRPRDRNDIHESDDNDDATFERDSAGDPRTSTERQRDLEATWIEPRQHSCAEKGVDSDGRSGGSSSSGGGVIDERKRKACKCVHVWVPAQTKVSAFRDTRVCIPVDDATQTFSALDFQRRTGYTTVLRNRTPLDDRDVGKRQMVPIQQTERVAPRRSSRHETEAPPADKRIDVRSLRNMLYNMANRWVRDNSHAEDWVGGTRALERWEDAHTRYLDRHPLAGLDRSRLSRQGSFVQKGARRGAGGGSGSRSNGEEEEEEEEEKVDEDGNEKVEEPPDDDVDDDDDDAKKTKRDGDVRTRKKRTPVPAVAAAATAAGDDGDDLRALAACMGPDCAAPRGDDAAPDDSDVEALQRAFVGAPAPDAKRNVAHREKTRASERKREETKRPAHRAERKKDREDGGGGGGGGDNEDDVMRFRPRYAYADDVEVRKSRLPTAGQGVVACRNFVAGQTIGTYVGTTVTRDELAHMNARDARYVVTVVDASGNSHSVDAEPAHFCGKINHLWREDVPRLGSANVEVTRELHIVCLREVRDGEELFYDYGPERWHYQQTGRDASSIQDTRLRLQALEATVQKLPNPTLEWARTHLEPRRR